MFQHSLPELFRVQLIGFIETTNAVAKRSESTDKRERVYAFKNLVLSQAIMSLSEEFIDVSYEMRPDGVHVVVVIHALRTSAFHIPFTKLSSNAQTAVCCRAGTPQEFLRERNRRMLSVAGR